MNQDHDDLRKAKAEINSFLSTAAGEIWRRTKEIPP